MKKNLKLLNYHIRCASIRGEQLGVLENHDGNGNGNVIKQEV